MAKQQRDLNKTCDWRPTWSPDLSIPGTKSHRTLLTRGAEASVEDVKALREPSVQERLLDAVVRRHFSTSKPFRQGGLTGPVPAVQRTRWSCTWS